MSTTIADDATPIEEIVNTDPPWEIDPDLLDQIRPQGKLFKACERYHVGLRSVVMDVSYRDAHGKMLQRKKLQILTFPEAEANEPTISPAVLAQIIGLRGVLDAEQYGILGSYTVRFYGDNTAVREDGPFQKQGSFRVDGTASKDDDDDEEEEEEEEEEAPMAFGMPTRMPTIKASLSRMPKPAEDTPEIAYLTNVAEMMMAQQTNFTNAMLQQNNAVLQQMMGLMGLNTNQFKEVFSELRAGLENFRHQYDTAFTHMHDRNRTQDEAVMALVSELRTDAAASRDEVSKANNRLVKITELKEADLRGQQEANRTSWAAFQQAQQMQFQALGQQMSWERVVMQMQFDALADKAREEKERTPKETPQWLKDFGPMVMMGLGAFLATKGVEGDFIDKMMEGAFGDGNDDDDDDEDVIDTEAKDVSGAKAKKTPEEAEVFFANNPLTAMLQVLDSMLEEQQRSALKAAVPAGSWTALTAAMKANGDTMSKAYLMQYVTSTRGHDDEIKAALTDKQYELHQDIVTKVQENIPDLGGHPTGTPPPPSTSS